MKFVHIAVTAAIAGMAMAGQAYAAEDMSALAKAKNCLTCHTVDKKVVGPAYKEVAAKYAGDAKALDTLAAKVKAGGKGNWGQVPMPPNNVTEEEAKKLVAWILSLK
ncbi:MAG: c-type cytochrome [Azonexus sp.]|jgi:cytochrome c|nr:c-type cytochrome [Azonexus sp.]